MFSCRVPSERRPNRLSAALCRARSTRRLLDLTVSNPTPRGHPLSRDASRAACRLGCACIRSRPVGPRRMRVGQWRRPTRAGGLPSTHGNRADREHERGVFTVVQAAVRSCSGGRVDAGPELSTLRSPRQPRWRRAAPLPARISRSLERRSRRGRSRVDGPHARRARRRAEQSHRIVPERCRRRRTRRAMCDARRGADPG